MRPKFRAVFLLIPLALAGCFQPASESVEPINSTAPAQNDPNVEQSGQPTAFEEINTTLITPTTGIVITIVEPTRSFASSTPEPVEQQPLPTQEGETGLPTQQFITPGAPLGPMTVAPVATGAPATTTPSGLITPTALPGFGASEDGECTYTVQSGDTLYRIAINNNTTVSALQDANSISGELIQPGDVLQLPDCNSGTDTTVSTSGDQSSEPSTDVVAPAGSETYTVQSGDTLFKIAQRFGTTVAALQDANNLSNPNQLSVGQELIIPATSG